jgi:oligopeptide/dipeptide ABC transporter ATP-binding protein
MSVETSRRATADGSADGRAVLVVDDLHVRFRAHNRFVHAVNGLSYSVQAGETVAIVGESGSGKSASANAILGLLPESAEVSGSAKVAGQELIGLSERQLRGHRGADISMVFQNPARSLNPTMCVGKQVVEAIRAHAPMTARAARLRAIDLFRMVRLPAPEHRFEEFPHQLSGGMRQRVMIAIALACSPKVLIADEATTALDVTTQAQVMNLLMDLQAQMGMALVMVTHDLGLARAYADDVVVLYAGTVLEHGSTHDLFDNVRVPYTRALMDARPRIDRPSHQPLPVVPGGAPDLSTPPVGCPFAPRCPLAQEKCFVQAPPVADDGEGHSYACWFPYSKGSS